MNRDLSSFFVFGQALSCVIPSRFAPLLTLAVLALGGPATRADWPEFRGPWGDGHVSAPGDTQTIGLPMHWSETNNVKWKTEIPHRGWSTPVVLGGQVWLTTAPDRCLLVYSRWPFKNAEGGACKAIILREIRVTRLPAVTH